MMRILYICRLSQDQFQILLQFLYWLYQHQTHHDFAIQHEFKWWLIFVNEVIICISYSLMLNLQHDYLVILCSISDNTIGFLRSCISLIFPPNLKKAFFVVSRIGRISVFGRGQLGPWWYWCHSRGFLDQWMHTIGMF